MDGIRPELLRTACQHGVCAKFAGYGIDDEPDLSDVARKLAEKQKSNFDHSLAIPKPESQPGEEKFKVQVVMAH
jgi:hypothetical protein